MREVTKEQFKEIYFKLGGGLGWTLEYWNKFFEDDKGRDGSIYYKSPKH